MSTTPAADIQPTRFGSGQAVRRLEDDALLAGTGQFTDDVTLPEQVALFFVRSPYPHARIVAVDSAAALERELRKAFAAKGPTIIEALVDAAHYAQTVYD